MSFVDYAKPNTQTRTVYTDAQGGEHLTEKAWAMAQKRILLDAVVKLIGDRDGVDTDNLMRHAQSVHEITGALLSLKTTYGIL